MTQTADAREAVLSEARKMMLDARLDEPGLRDIVCAVRARLEPLLLAYGNARIEEAAKVAEGYMAGGDNGYYIAARIRSLATKEGEDDR